jgi:Holliday junction resolvase
MPNRNYEAGARRERAIIAHLEAEGYVAYRSAGSHGNADIIAVRYPRIIFIQSKVASLSENEELKIYMNMCREVEPKYYYLQNKVLQGAWADVKKAIKEWD